MERVVDHRLAFGACHPLVRRVTERVAGVRNCEIDESRYAPPRSGASAGAVIIGRYGAHEGQLEMNVYIEDAWYYVMAFRVDDSGLRAGFQVLSDRGDLLSLMP